jgi:hypothetical protein
MGKVFKKITKPIQKLIPKEIKPFLPALAAVFGPAAFASMGGGIGAAFAKLPAFAQAAIVNATTQGVVEGKIDPKQVAASGIMAQAGSSLKNLGSNLPQGKLWDQILKIFYKKQLLLLVNIYNQVP